MRTLHILIIGFAIALPGCKGCSRSGQKQLLQESGNNTPAEPRSLPKQDSPADKTTVRMEETDGVYKIPVEIDGVKLFFIFDTGASTISISESEAVLLRKQGLLEDIDIKGNANYTDANGTLSEGTVINLKTVKIGDKILNNVEASVVHTLNAPLLIGQSALAKFGKISIDYVNKTITFE